MSKTHPLFILMYERSIPYPRGIRQLTNCGMRQADWWTLICHNVNKQMGLIIMWFRLYIIRAVRISNLWLLMALFMPKPFASLYYWDAHEPCVWCINLPKYSRVTQCAYPHQAKLAKAVWSRVSCGLQAARRIPSLVRNTTCTMKVQIFFFFAVIIFWF